MANMGEQTKIQWATHTFNHVRGCQKIAQGCKFCYAEKLVNGRMQGHFSKQRVRLSDAGWKEPVRWNRQAECNCGAAGTGGRECDFCSSGCVRPRVFCASLADVFEDWGGPIVDHKGRRLFLWQSSGEVKAWDDMPPSALPNCRAAIMDDLRRDLFRLSAATPNLDKLFLTKRPENIRPMIERTVGVEWWKEHCYASTWLGTSIATQADADRNIPELLQCRDLSPVLFVSAEPLIEEVDLRNEADVGGSYDWLTGTSYRFSDGGVEGLPTLPSIDWVIVGGESGANARPCELSWIREIAQQCKSADVACFVKQLGTRVFGKFDSERETVTLELKDKKGGDPAEWPNDLSVREFPSMEASCRAT